MSSVYHSIEFFQFEKEVWYSTLDGTKHKLTERSREIIRLLLSKVENCYSVADKALSKEYARFKWDIELYEFKKASRFIRCNFSAIDHVSDIDEFGGFNFEHISCPLRGICEHEGKICSPPIDTGIGKEEMRAVKLLCKHKERVEIAEILGKSEPTIRNQINNVYTKLGINEKAQLIEYMLKNNLLED